MYWKHECSLAWLQARQKFITASEVGKLAAIKFAKRKPKVSYEDKMEEFFVNKRQQLTKADCVSYGAAARGHLLEPYAIEELNKIIEIPICHWDDCIVTNSSCLAWSPDGLNMFQPENQEEICVANIRNHNLIGVEIKSYDVPRHLNLAKAPLSTLEERWQIATAFSVCPNLSTMLLVGFNPKLTVCGLHYRTITRNDLIEEIEAVEQIACDYINYAHANNYFSSFELTNCASDVVAVNTTLNEDDIYEETMSPLNP